MNPSIEFFHFRTIPALVVVALLAGVVGAVAPVLLLIAAAALLVAALKSLFVPGYLGLGKISLPVGRIDALIWISLVPIFALMALAMMHGLPPTAYLIAKPS